MSLKPENHISVIAEQAVSKNNIPSAFDTNGHQNAGSTFPQYALMSILIVPSCGLLGFLGTTQKEADFTGLGFYMVVYIWLLAGAISGLVLLKISRRKNETVNVLRKVSLIVNWGALVFLAAVPFILSMLY